MYSLLVRLMVLSALLQLGLSLRDVSSCRSSQCLVRLEKDSRKVLNVDWKPISVFPEEGKRFR